MRFKTYFILAILCVSFYSTSFAALLGDANGNGKLDLGDAVFFLQAQAGLRSGGRGELADAIAIMQTLVGLNPERVLPDMAPPSAPLLNTPSDLDVAYNLVKLWWLESSDDVGVAGYSIYRDNVKVGETTGTNTFFNDTVNVNPSTSYAYQVKAFDEAGNVSQGSDIITVLTPVRPGTVDVGGRITP